MDWGSGTGHLWPVAVRTTELRAIPSSEPGHSVTRPQADRRDPERANGDGTVGRKSLGPESSRDEDSRGGITAPRQRRSFLGRPSVLRIAAARGDRVRRLGETPSLDTDNP